MEQTVEHVIEQHKSAGKFFTVNGLRTFARDHGSGEAVLCIHGVPTSSFLYRKLLRELAANDMRGVCIDLPGLGLSDRPEDFDYSFPHFARFLALAARKLELEKFHLVVHDIGGPIGFALAAANPEKILSITILNTWIDVVNFEKPLPMRPFEKPILGEAELATITHLTWPLAFRKFAVADSTGITTEEINAYVDMLKREDSGKAFLKIMRNFDHSQEFRELCHKAVQNVPYPVQAIWGAEDPGLTYGRYGEEIRKVAGLASIQKLPASHFMQEEAWKEIAESIVKISNKKAT